MSRFFVTILITTLFLGGCATPVSVRFAPEIDKAKHVANLCVCHGADVIRFTATGIGNVIEQSTKGFVNLAVHGGNAAATPEGAVILAITWGVLGTGAGIVKTIENWEPGIQDCLKDMGYAAPPEEQTSGRASS